MMNSTMIPKLQRSETDYRNAVEIVKLIEARIDARTHVIGGGFEESLARFEEYDTLNDALAYAKATEIKTGLAFAYRRCSLDIKRFGEILLQIKEVVRAAAEAEDALFPVYDESDFVQQDFDRLVRKKEQLVREKDQLVESLTETIRQMASLGQSLG